LLPHVTITAAGFTADWDKAADFRPNAVIKMRPDLSISLRILWVAILGSLRRPVRIFAISFAIKNLLHAEHQQHVRLVT
jgi:hypothetical protein